VLIRTRVSEIRETGRAAQGVRLINLDEGEHLIGLEKVAESETEDELTDELSDELIEDGVVAPDSETPQEGDGI
jgi:DNA gyrase subunit A